MDRRPGQIKLHYVDCDDKFDVWVAAGEKDPTPIMKHVGRVGLSGSLEERWSAVFHDVAVEIKRWLSCHRSCDPSVRLAVRCEKDVGDELVMWSAGRSFKEMEDALGKGWYYKICNAAGDFAYIVESTFKINGKISSKQDLFSVPK